TGNLADLPITPFAEVRIDDALHLIASAMAVCVVLHECSGHSAEGALLFTLLSYLWTNASMRIGRDLVSLLTRLLKADTGQPLLVILADSDAPIFAVHADADEERLGLFSHPNAEALNLAPLPYVHLPLRWVLQPPDHFVGKHAHPFARLQ